ncbi:hypothetical protein C8F04DRAFT_1137994 [Mycena alexandri]|uniref:Uncharacterized protein n=1 Tax=Mycena alexandri TaxID=1745969 RepID=A0AAD6SA11_9AGAR|nr:hypothetical protein C8F04DRAFT_1137994 [Mycena alexandri]
MLLLLSPSPVLRVNFPRGTSTPRTRRTVICARFPSLNSHREYVVSNGWVPNLRTRTSVQPTAVSTRTRASSSISPTAPSTSVGPVSMQSIPSTSTITTSAQGSYSRTSVPLASSTQLSTESTFAQFDQGTQRVAEIVGLSVGLPVFCGLLGLFFLLRRRRRRGSQSTLPSFFRSPIDEILIPTAQDREIQASAGQ